MEVAQSPLPASRLPIAATSLALKHKGVLSQKACKPFLYQPGGITTEHTAFPCPKANSLSTIVLHSGKQEQGFAFSGSNIVLPSLIIQISHIINLLFPKIRTLA